MIEKVIVKTEKDGTMKVKGNEFLPCSTTQLSLVSSTYCVVGFKRQMSNEGSSVAIYYRAYKSIAEDMRDIQKIGLIFSPEDRKALDYFNTLNDK